MTFLITPLAVVLMLVLLLGGMASNKGDSFADTVRKGLNILFFLILAALAIYLYMQYPELFDF